MSMTNAGSGTAPGALRIAVDIGGTFTDVAAFDEGSGELLLGKWSSTPRDLVEGILLAIDESGGDLAAGEPGAARLDGGDQRHPRAARRAHRARHHARLPRRLRDRPHQPARVVQPVLPQARAARPAQPPLRGRGAAERRGRGADPLQRGAGAKRSRATWSPRASRAWRSSSCTATATRRTSCGCGEMLRAVAPSLFVTLSHELSREYREYERTAPRWPTPSSARSCARYLDHLEQVARERGFRGTLLLMQSRRRPVRRGHRPRAVHPDARVGPRGRRGRRRGAVRRAGHRRTPSASTWAARRRRRR